MNKKRANGEGCIRQRKDGSWEAIITIGRNTGTGKLIRKSFYGKTQAEVRKKLTASAHTLDEGIFIEPSKLTLTKWCDVWLAEYMKSVKFRTLELYKQQVRLHIKPTLGAVKLQLLSAPMIQSMYNAKLESGLSTKTIKNLHGILHKALSQAVKIGYIRFNPADACELPRIEKKAIKPLENDQVTAFLQEIEGHKHQNFFTVALFSGLRQGEMLGLTWDCLDFAKGTLTVNKQLQRRKLENGNVEYVFCPTKNDKMRTMTLASSVLYRLRMQRQRQLEWRLAAGNAWDNANDLVFTDEIGKHLCVNTVYHAFKKIIRRLGIDDVRFHDLRHTYATLSLQNGDDIKTTSKNLGHATVAFTLDTYGHVTEQMKNDSAARMEAYIQSAK